MINLCYTSTDPEAPGIRRPTTETKRIINFYQYVLSFSSMGGTVKGLRLTDLNPIVSASEK